MNPLGTREVLDLNRNLVEVFRTMDDRKPSDRWVTGAVFQRAWDQIVGSDFPNKVDVGTLLERLHRNGTIQVRKEGGEVHSFSLSTSVYLGVDHRDPGNRRDRCDRTTQTPRPDPVYTGRRQ